VFAASGDFAYDNVNIGFTTTVGGASPSYPASSPYVIAVGGTALYDVTATPTFGEGVWDDGRFGLVQASNAETAVYQDVTTSGCSTEFAMPPWQASALAGSSCSMRATADVSAFATYFSGGSEKGIEIVLNGVVAGPVEGTSAASPFVAALFTRLGLTDEISNNLGWAYSNLSAFNDVGSSGYTLPSGATLTDAPSGSSCGILCTAQAGWDGPSGVGSPNGTKLAALPVSTTTAPYPDAGICGPFGVTCVADDGGPASGSDAGSSGSDDGGGSGSGSGSSSGGASGSGSGGSFGADSGAGSGGSGGGSSSGGGGGGGGGCSATPSGPSSSLGWLAITGALAVVGARRKGTRNAS
jgi:subtilase family serine protease